MLQRSCEPTRRGNSFAFPLRRSPQFHRGSLPPLLGRGMNPRPATKGAYPLGTPDRFVSPWQATGHATNQSKTFMSRLVSLLNAVLRTLFGLWTIVNRIRASLNSAA
jgi:hypothetical protein